MNIFNKYLTAFLLLVSVTVHGAVPEHIMLSLCGDPAHTAAVSWRTCFQDTVTMAQIAPDTASPNLKDIRTISGSHSPWESNMDYAMGHKVCFTELEPSTSYQYRVGDGNDWSEWIQFSTASQETEPFSFLYLGDFQNDIKTLASRAIRKAYSHFPDSRFILWAGDLVRVNTREYWDEFFYAGGWIYSHMPSLAVPGNHEYRGGDMPHYSWQWDQIFSLPQNAPTDSYMNRVWYIDYQGVRFIGLDGSKMTDKEDGDMLCEWFEDKLKTNPCKWCIVVVHQPIWKSASGRNENPAYMTRMKSLYEKYGVDLVLQGHDHTYCRGFNMSEVGEGCINPPMYVVSVSGPKLYGLGTYRWADRYASDTQFYQNISIDGDVLSFECYDITGKLYDAFKLRKRPGRSNKFIEDKRVKDIPMKTGMPKNSLKRYSPEDLELYYKLYGS